MVNFYQVLGLRRESGAEEIRGAYREKAKETHPDLGGDGALFLAVKEAYEILRDPEKRIEWERSYRAFWEGKGAVLCLLCFSATRKGGCCRVCGEQSEAEAEPFALLSSAFDNSQEARIIANAQARSCVRCAWSFGKDSSFRLPFKIQPKTKAIFCAKESSKSRMCFTSLNPQAVVWLKRVASFGQPSCSIPRFL